MYLKRVEMCGFKSFAEKIELDFPVGITAVVGPNGSGKSNISDAIQWVLGEQSAKSLRGTRMEDVIFNGTASRRPLGMAEVTLILDNTDGQLPLAYQEVQIMRRLYRSGESEYRLNQTPCRLKDIQELLADTGLGKDAYSVIGQGKIEEILSARSEDRRALLEEAAGVVRYKNRKREAMRKLEETQLNMLRINDIRNELGQQVGPLAEQAADAEKYQRWHSRLVELQIAGTVRELVRLRSDLSLLQEQEQSRQDRLAATSAAGQSLEAAIEADKVALLSLNDRFTARQQELHRLDGEWERAEGSLTLTGERRRAWLEQKSGLEAELGDLAAKLAEQTAVIAAEEANLDSLLSDFDGQEAAIGTENRRLEAVLREIDQRGSQLEQWKSEIIDWMNHTAARQYELNTLEAETESTVRVEQKLTAEGEANRENAARTWHQIDAVEERIAAIQAENQRLQTDLQAKQQEKQRLVAELAQQRAAAAGQREQISSISARQKVLTDLQAEYEGYQRGVRSVLLGVRKKRLDGTGICGVLSELIRVPAEYEAAISIALGGSLQNIVTDTTGAAERAIEYLKQTSGGRATFLPVEAVKGQAAPAFLQAVRPAPGVIGFAAELVEAPAKYARILQHLLGQVLVVDKLNNATRLAKNLGYRARIVTLEGDLLTPGGAISGGSAGSQTVGLLARGREITALKNQVAAIQAELTAGEEKMRQLAAAAEAVETVIQGAERSRHDNLIAVATAEKDREQLHADLARLSKEAEVIGREHENNRRRQGQIQAQTEELRAALGELVAATAERQQRVSELQSRLGGDLANKEELSGRITNNRINLATLHQKKENAQATLVLYRQLAQEYTEKQAELAGRIADLDGRGSAAAAEEQAVRVLQDELAGQRAIVQRQCEELRQERQQAEAGLGEQEKEAKRLSRSRADLQDELHALGLRRNRLEVEAAAGELNLRTAYNVTPEQADAIAAGAAGETDLPAQIRRLQADIDRLGPVNPGAIAEYARVRERHAFLEQQYTDLEQAQSGLGQIVGEMDRVMKKQFLATLAAVRECFTGIFQDLFGGGQADLQLTDAANVLESGVEIIAQPPGKKLQNLLLLSGGERALTAISLLLAILRVRPSPFCVLDEIDASLDEANVDRFARFLKEFAPRTQFVVVTHRKGTMEIADLLYGVTMEESGVSKMLSVRLLDAAG